MFIRSAPIMRMGKSARPLSDCGLYGQNSKIFFVTAQDLWICGYCGVANLIGLPLENFALVSHTTLSSLQLFLPSGMVQRASPDHIENGDSEDVAVFTHPVCHVCESVDLK